MLDSPVLLWLLGVMSVCLVVISITMVATARELRRLLRRLNRMLPGVDRAFLELFRSLRHVRRFLAAAARASDRVEAVVQEAAGVVSGTLDQLSHWKHRAERAIKSYTGNGAGAGSRSHRRGR